ncbi:ankyrin repeat domain-containing protein 53 [Nycticebus coucang]|uniref:ankyrin repeat domain-containing protein 53 n=1 Tax=Nycticebus coucang TaxID=9470 RepID=UPI00234CCEAB|nr:ankyrin repeat domain-containing protein 53 [Nycticebus coucang]
MEHLSWSGALLRSSQGPGSSSLDVSVPGGTSRRGAFATAASGGLHRTEKFSLKFIWSDGDYKQLSDEQDQRVIGNYYELFAAAVGNVQWLRFCLDRDSGEIRTDSKPSPVWFWTPQGFTALHFAAQRGKLACLQILIEEYDFPVDLPTNNSQTPLHLVIHRDNKTMALPCISYLLGKGAALNAQTCNGSTPLHLAAHEGLLGCVKVLVQSGADVHAQDAMGLKPIDFCKIWNHRACARFLKDAMWKRNKSDFAHEMGKLKRLKDQLVIMEKNYLIEYQKKQKILRKDDFKKWLQGKLTHQGHSLVHKQAHAITLSKTQQLSKSLHPSVEARLQRIPPPPREKPKKPQISFYSQPSVRRPTMWNVSTNPATQPSTQISFPQDIRLGIHPDPSLEHDFSSFLEVTPDRQGGAWLHTVDGHWVTPVPQLPFEVIVRTLYPSTCPYRMKVPQGLYSISMRDVPRKRYLGDDTFWTDTMAMNLRQTFDKAFLAALQAHQGLPTLPSPKTNP